MKKILVVLGFVSLLIPFSFAQKSVNNNLPDRLFKQGKEMFIDKNYVGSQNSLEEYKKHTSDNLKIEEADYMIVASHYFLGNEDAGNKMKEYLDSNPETYHRDQLCFYIASTHFSHKEWKLALYWLKQADVDYLPMSEQEDYTFRRGYASLQEEDLEVARQSFGLLSQNSKKYNDAAVFYLTYIDFKKGNYDKALKVFNQYKAKTEYAEEASFFLIQGEFLNNNLSKTITDAEAYAIKYPQSKNIAEIHRILGNSFSRTGDDFKSIMNYEKYVALTKNPLREDMYLLGTTYKKRGDNEKAVNTLKLVASTTDKLGQAAYMQLGQSYLALNDNTNALMAFDAAAREKYDSSISEVALYNYSVLVYKTSLSAFDQSITVLERFLNEYPNSSYTKNINTLLASTLLSTNNHKAALSAINKLKSPDSQILAAKQSILFKMGTDNFINSDYTSAISNLSASINMGNYDNVAKRQAQFWRGESYYRLGNYTTAITDYSSYLSNAPTSDKNYGLALYNLGYAQFQLKQYSNALRNFQKYVETEKDKKSATYADALNRLGDCNLYSRNFAAAEKYYAQASSNGSTGADYADYQRAFVLGLQHNYSGKVTALDAMIKKYPNSSYKNDALFEKASTQILMNKDGDAINTLNVLLANDPRPDLAQEAGILLGQTYYNNSNNIKAIEAYKGAVAINPNSENGRAAIQSLEGLYKDENDVNTYISYVNSLGSGIVISATRQDSLTYMAAENLLLKGSNDKAETSLKQYLQSYPNGAFAGDAHFNLGSIAYTKKDTDKALSEFMATVKGNNSRYINEALEYAAKLQFAKADYQTAYTLYNQLNTKTLDKDIQHTAQLGMLRCAFALNKNNDVISAANALLSAIKVSPEVETEARFFRAKAYLNLHQNDKALTDLQVVAKDTRTVYGAESQFLIAETYYNAKSYAKAQKQVTDFMQVGTSHEYWMARALIILSDSYAAQGDNFQARQYLESLQANYKNPEADIVSMINERLAKLN